MRLDMICEDKFDQWRSEIGAEKVDNLLLSLGLGPKYKHIPKPKHICPNCGKKEAIYKEMGGDTDYNCMELYCNKCGYSKEF